MEIDSNTYVNAAPKMCMGNSTVEIQQARSEKIAKRAEQAIGSLNLGEVSAAKFQLQMIKREAEKNRDGELR